MSEKNTAPLEVLSGEDLLMLKDLRFKNALLASRAEKALLEARAAELEYKLAVQEMYLKYSLSLKDSIDEVSGKIIKHQESV